MDHERLKHELQSIDEDTLLKVGQALIGKLESDDEAIKIWHSMETDYAPLASFTEAVDNEIAEEYAEDKEEPEEAAQAFAHGVTFAMIALKSYIDTKEVAAIISPNNKV